MTIQPINSDHSKLLNDHEESAPMNLDSLSRLQTQVRQSEVRHHLEERTLELAANRRRRRIPSSGKDGSGLLNRFVGRLAPRRVASAGGNKPHPGIAQEAADEPGNSCSQGRECGGATAHPAA
jgi:hypothetical protein